MVKVGWRNLWSKNFMSGARQNHNHKRHLSLLRSLKQFSLMLETAVKNGDWRGTGVNFNCLRLLHSIFCSSSLVFCSWSSWGLVGQRRPLFTHDLNYFLHYHQMKSRFSKATFSLFKRPKRQLQRPYNIQSWIDCFSAKIQMYLNCP